MRHAGPERLVAVEQVELLLGGQLGEQRGRLAGCRMAASHAIPAASKAVVSSTVLSDMVKPPGGGNPAVTLPPALRGYRQRPPIRCG